jgi:hypothetical protein
MPPKLISTSARNGGRKRKPQGASGALHVDSDSDADLAPSVLHSSETPLSATSVTTSIKSVHTPRGASGAIHADSDEDFHVETSLHIDSSSQRATTSYQAFSTKRQRVADPEATQAVPAIDLDKRPEPAAETPDEVKKRKQVRCIFRKIAICCINSY